MAMEQEPEPKRPKRGVYYSLFKSQPDEQFKKWGLDKGRFLNGFSDLKQFSGQRLAVVLSPANYLFVIDQKKQCILECIKDPHHECIHKNPKGTILVGMNDQIIELNLDKETGYKVLKGVISREQINTISCDFARGTHYLLVKTTDPAYVAKYFKEISMLVQYEKNETRKEIFSVGPCLILKAK